MEAISWTAAATPGLRSSQSLRNTAPLDLARSSLPRKSTPATAEQ